jgi:hypothetical protein
MVWVHVGLATLTWLVILWAVAAAGRVLPSATALPAGDLLGAPAELEVAGSR